MILAARRGLAPRVLLLLDQATFSLANFILTMALARHNAGNLHLRVLAKLAIRS